jgi:SAM-dependent methyltransferase
MFTWMAMLVGLMLIGAILYLEVYRREGYPLRPRLQGWFSDQWVGRYGLDKQGGQADDANELTRPLVRALAEVQSGATMPLALDLATGPGRLPQTLLSEPGFAGRVIALDMSRWMLTRAAEKLAPYGRRAALMQHGTMPLPFVADTFDLVTYVEALAMVRNERASLAEFARVLRPGGVLMVPHGRGALGYHPTREALVAGAFATLLDEAGFELVEVVPWRTRSDLILARKRGKATPADARSLTDVLCCPVCGAVALEAVLRNALRCRKCRAQVPVTPEGIVLYY